jgi:YVTN family beta-propeller protein
MAGRLGQICGTRQRLSNVKENAMLKSIIGAVVLLLVTNGILSAQDHTIVAHSQADSMVFELDPASGKILHQLKVASQPHEGAVTPDGKMIFVSVPSSAHVVIIDGMTFQEKAKVESEFFRRTPRPRPSTGNAPARPPNTSASPHGVAVTEDGGKLYIGVENADVPGLVVYDVRAGKVLKKIDLLLTGGHYFAMQPKTGKIYYPHKEDNRVVVIDTKTDKVVKLIAVGGGPRGVAFGPHGDVWFHSDGDGSVTMVDSKTDEVVKVIPTEGKGIGRIAVSPDGRYAASTHDQTLDVAVIDTQTKQVVKNIRVGSGSGPSSASLKIMYPLFSPDSSKLYVMNPSDSDISVIDVKDWTIVARHKVLPNTFGGVVRPLRLLGTRN